MYLPQAWYDTCDEMGVLVFHDIMYAQQGHAPTADATQAAELSHNVRRLSHHASIVLFDGCNEVRVASEASCSNRCLTDPSAYTEDLSDHLVRFGRSARLI